MINQLKDYKKYFKDNDLNLYIYKNIYIYNN